MVDIALFLRRRPNLGCRISTLSREIAAIGLRPRRYASSWPLQGMPMEADWEVEIGPGAPVIDAEWSGFIDLRRTPGRIGEIAEVQQFPALAEVLLRLNGPHSDLDAITSTAVWGSSIWTSKCDFWTLEQCDPYEMDATFKESIVGFGCYIDVLSRDELV